MPNPRANRPLTLDRVTADLKSLSQPAQALFDMMAGGLRGSAVGTLGAPGDIETLARMGVNAAGGSFNPAMPSRSGRAFQPVSEEPFFPSSEELAKRFAPTIPNGDPVRRKSAEPFEEVGQFAPLPMSGKALKVLPYALGRGAGEATKMTGQALSDAMIHQTGPLSQGPLSMLAPKGAVSHVFEPNPNWKTNTVNFGKPTPGIMIPSKMSNVREAVRDLKGNYGARRVERAADEIPNLERMFQEGALKEAFTGDNASAMITLSPAEFERYSIELSKRHDIGPKMAQLAKEGNIDKYTVPTDEYIQYLQRLNEGFSDVPYLNLSKDEVGLPTMPRVIGHEGRHRSRALAEQGAPTSLVQINPRGDLREGMPRRTQEEFIEALKEEIERSNRLVLPEKDGEYRRPAIELPEPYAEGGSVNISDNPDTMMMELGDKHFQVGGIVDLAARAAKAAKAAKSNLVIKSKPGMIVSKLIDEEPDIARRLGAEARAKRQAAIEAEGQRKQLAAQTQPSVGYRPSTPQKPDPLVGTRYVNEPEFGLNPNEPFDIAKFKGGSGMVLPWDSQSRNVKTTQVSGVDLPNQIFNVTHGGIPYAFDTAHVSKGVAGASGLDIAKRVKTRADTAVQESIGRGGTGELLHFPITMGFRAEDYALPYSEFSFDIINHKLMTGELTQKEVDELTKMVRNFEPPNYKGKKPFAEFAGFTDPEGLNQIYTGEGLKVPPGELRKAIADRMIWQKGSQEKLGFNAEDLMNATTYEPLRGVDKGFIGSTVMRNSPGGMKLSPSAGKYPYDTDFSGEHLGRLEDLIDVEALFHRTLNPIKRELITRENLKPYNKESLRNAAIGAIERRNEGISQPIDQQFLDDYADYLNELKKPHEYKNGGAITVKPKQDGQKFKPGKKPDPILKHGQAMPRGKDPVVDISQMMPMMARGGEVNADDLILEERPL